MDVGEFVHVFRLDQESLSHEVNTSFDVETTY
jgi:hypothetical protein